MGVLRSTLKWFTLIRGMMDEFHVSRTSSGVVVLLLVVTTKLTSIVFPVEVAMVFCYILLDGENLTFDLTLFLYLLSHFGQ